MKEKLLLIINPVSGLSVGTFKKNELEKIFSKKYDVTVMRTAQKGDGTKYAEENAENFDIVIACGGDGTINEVMLGLLSLEREKRPVFGFVPGGTTNLLSDALNLPSNMTEAAREILNRDVRLLDIGKINDKYFAAVISFGAFTEASYATSQGAKNILGYVAYVLGGIRSIAELRGYQMKITANGEVIEDNFVFGAISNCYSLGGVIRLTNEQVKIDDGLFEVMLVKMPDSPLGLQKIVTGLTLREYDQKYIRFFHASRLKIEIKEEIPWTVDGEYFGNFGNANIEILPHAFDIK